jgi:hypothetical protein
MTASWGRTVGLLTSVEEAMVLLSQEIHMGRTSAEASLLAKNP